MERCSYILKIMCNPRLPYRATERRVKMDKIEAVKKILDKYLCDWVDFITTGEKDQFEEIKNHITNKICQIFEPKPDKNRLLTDEELLEILDGHWENFLIKAYRKKLTAKIASIKDAEYQVQVEISFKEGEVIGYSRGFEDGIKRCGKEWGIE